MRCTRSPACVRIFLLARLSSGPGDRCRYHASSSHPKSVVAFVQNPYSSSPETDVPEGGASQPPDILHVVGAVLLAMLLLLLITACVLARPAVDRSLLTKIVPGMTKPQVALVLGQPNKTYGDSEWLYWRWGNAGWVEVWFDDSDRVDYINDESAFP